MTWRNSRTALFGAVALFCFFSGSPIVPAVGQQPSDDIAMAEQLTRLALQAEIAGQSDRRDKLLQQALHAAPDYAPARWQAGQIRVDDAWQSIEEAPKSVADEQKLEDYRALRDLHAGSVEGHRALARWCRRQNLDDEARTHWLHVVQARPDDEEAARALGMRWFHGSLLTYEQINDLKQTARQAAEDMRRWKPTLIRWRRAIEGADVDACEDALRQLHELDDPTAIPALEAVFSHERRGSRDLDLSLEAVAVLGRMDDPDATVSLVRHAVMSSWPEVRAAAADLLGRRPLHEFVPTLLGELESPIEVTSYVYNYPDTAVISGIALYQEGPREDRSLLFGSTLRMEANPNPPGVLVRDRPWAPQKPLIRRAVRSAGIKSASVRTRIENANRQIAFTNSRIIESLSRATGMELPAEPRLWWNWWQDFNERHSSPNKPVNHRYYLATYEWYSPRLPDPRFARTGSCSCFDGGTAVHTLRGLLPIEQIRPGDRVLSQDPRSGELAYKPVLATTTRPPSDLTVIGVGGERISATQGHPLWVTGRGWRMVKNLTTDMSLHGVRGSLPVESLTSGGRHEAFNLVVADFHNYFVGQHGLLAHDNTVHQPPPGPLPGFSVVSAEH